MSITSEKRNLQDIVELKKSCIIISNSFELDREILKNAYKNENLRIYSQEELKIEDSSEIIREAHISTTEPKLIAIFANSYNQFSQNALLKTLEEIPKNIIFMLFITSKNKLIKTIFSRLAHFDLRTKESIKPIELDLERLNIPMVYEYISKIEKENLSIQQGREILAQILQNIANNNTTSCDLDKFDLALKALNARQSVHLALLPLLLSLTRR